MKRPAIWTLALLAVCAVFTLSAPEGRAAEIHVSDPKGLREAVAAAHDGDTVILDVDCTILADNDDPWVIDKAVTIQGGSISCRKGGILLAADVTFQNTAIGFSSFVCDSIMANGHTLTLDNVTYPVGARPVNLVCGGLYTETGYYGGYVPAGGGKIVIRGRTSLASTHEGVGNIYAGNLCLGGMTEDQGSVHGPANTFEGSPQIIIEAERGSELGRIYAGGVEEKIPERQPNGKVFLTNPNDYTVSGTVSIQLHAATVTYVNGLGAGGTDVTYTDTRDDKFVTDTLGLYQIDSLTVESGHVSPKADSSFVSGAALTVKPGAKLGLEQMGNVTVGSFTGGGKLCLGQWQTLEVMGTVAESTNVVIGGFGYGDISLKQPVAMHVYIQAPQSLENAFTLLPPSGQEELAFTKSAGGEWSSKEGLTETIVKVSDFRFAEERIVWESETRYDDGIPIITDEEAVLDFLPVKITVNGTSTELVYNEDYGLDVYRYEVVGDALLLYISGMYLPEDSSDAALSILMEDFNGVIPDGIYRIEVTVAGTNTYSGEPITASTTLVVGDVSCEIGTIDIGTDSVTVYLQNSGAFTSPSTVMAAVYDAAGRFLRFAGVPIPEGGASSVEVPLSTSGGARVKAFLTDAETAAPLCPSLQANLP